MDYLIKAAKYMNAGVREYWVVDLKDNLVTVFNFENDATEHYRFGEEVPVGIYEGFSIKLPL